jgi:hypothetical protein
MFVCVCVCVCVCVRGVWLGVFCAEYGKRIKERTNRVDGAQDGWTN